MLEADKTALGPVVPLPVLANDLLPLVDPALFGTSFFSPVRHCFYSNVKFKKRPDSYGPVK